LPLIMEQDHPEFEVIVVNDHSTDETEYLMDSWTHAYPNLRLINLNRDNAKVRGKKFAISIGIKGAKYERIVFTDADCRPRTRHWLRHMSAAFGQNKEIVLGFGALEQGKGFINRIVRYDSFAIAMQYMSFALAGAPYMGVGRNLAYVKELFFRTKGFIRHRHIQSGDDDLLVNEVASATNTVICVAQEAHTLSQPKSTLSEYWVQKRRHLSTSGYYNARSQFLLALFSSAWWVFHVALLTLVLVPGSLPLALAAYLLRTIIMASVYLPAMRTLGESDLFLLSPVADVVSMVFNTAASMSNILMKPTRWR
jgi:biofilm PGA synthesis N-glycosyltransferase PgaC